MHPRLRFSEGIGNRTHIDDQQFPYRLGSKNLHGPLRRFHHTNMQILTLRHRPPQGRLKYHGIDRTRNIKIFRNVIERTLWREHLGEPDA